MNHQNLNMLLVKRMGIDTYSKQVIYMRKDCHICLSEGFEALSRVAVKHNNKIIITTLNIVDGDLLEPGRVGLSESAWHALSPQEDDSVHLFHPEPLTSLSHVRSKIYGHALSEPQMESIMKDIVHGRYDDVHLSSFITACAGNRLNLDEVVDLTQSMINTGSRISWDEKVVVDKHCVGGLPGNRTTLIIVPIVTAFGLTMPKTSSRAITSPAGTADTMETLAPVNLTVEKIQEVVRKVGGCIAWGGAVHLSPADDILIAVERRLDVDSEGQLIASVLSKKVAAGSSHVLIDIPVGPTAKIRSLNIATHLADTMIKVGDEIGLNVRTKITQGEQPVGFGIGPALEALDVIAVLRNDKGAPQDLRERSILLAGEVLEFCGEVPFGSGHIEAEKILDDGRAWEKFQAICEAQGGMREPTVADHRRDVTAAFTGYVEKIDNRRLALTAKLAGAPIAPSAGIYLHVKQGQPVEKGQPLFTVHAEAPGELDYAMDYITLHKDIISIRQPG
jgi:thymidine phosphorylase